MAAIKERECSVVPVLVVCSVLLKGWPRLPLAQLNDPSDCLLLLPAISSSAFLLFLPSLPLSSSSSSPLPVFSSSPRFLLLFLLLSSSPLPLFSSSVLLLSPLFLPSLPLPSPPLPSLPSFFLFPHGGGSTPSFCVVELNDTTFCGFALLSGTREDESMLGTFFWVEELVQQNEDW